MRKMRKGVDYILGIGDTEYLIEIKYTSKGKKKHKVMK